MLVFFPGTGTTEVVWTRTVTDRHSYHKEKSQGHCAPCNRVQAFSQLFSAQQHGIAGEGFALGALEHGQQIGHIHARARLARNIQHHPPLMQHDRARAMVQVA